MFLDHHPRIRYNKLNFFRFINSYSYQLLDFLFLISVEETQIEKDIIQNMNIKKHGNGSFTSEEVFNSEEEAKEYLVKRAQMYYDEFEGQVDEHLESIEKYGVLEIDAVTAHIEEIEEEEAEDEE